MTTSTVINSELKGWYTGSKYGCSNGLIWYDNKYSYYYDTNFQCINPSQITEQLNLCGKMACGVLLHRKWVMWNGWPIIDTPAG